MPGLLDILGGNFGTDDPRQAAYLALASGLMSGRGSFNQVAGNALMDAQKNFQTSNQLKQRSDMTKLEMEQMKRKAAQDEMLFNQQQALNKLPSQYIVPPSQPGVDATGGMDTALEAPQNQASPQGRYDIPGLSRALMATPGGFSEGLKLQDMMRKQVPDIKSLGRGGGAYIDPATNQVVRIPGEESTPKQAPVSPLAKLLAERAALPPGSPQIKAYDDMIRKETQFAPNAASQVIKVVTPSNVGLTGEEFLKTLAPQDAVIVKAIAEGKQTLGNVSVRAGQRQQIAAAVQQYKPDFSQPTYANQAAVQKDFTSGQSAKNVTAINTTIGHMGTMLSAVDALQNGDIPAANTVLNKVLTAFGKPQVNNYDIAKQAVANELMRVFRQVQASEQETKDWEARFISSGSPEQLKEGIRMGVDLLKSRVEALDDQYKRGMNSDTGYPNLLSPKSKEVINRLEGGSNKKTLRFDAQGNPVQ